MLYRIVVRSITTLLRMALWLSPRRKSDSKTWLRARLTAHPISQEPLVWVHAVSVGEARLAQVVINSWAKNLQSRTLITTSTHSGYEVLCKHFESDQVRPLPFDRLDAYRTLFAEFQVPRLVVIETEIWPEMFRFADEVGQGIVIINARLSVKTTRWRWLPLLRRSLERVDRICARSQADGTLFQAMGVAKEKILVTGNIKYDYPLPSILPKELTEWLERDQSLVIFASISADEVVLLAKCAEYLIDRGHRILWVPRHLDRLDTHLQVLSDLRPRVRSLLETGDTAPCVVLDSYGELAACYKQARLAVVGGSFNRRGGQNFLESLMQGTPVIVGPSTDNFRIDVAEAVKAGAVIQVKSVRHLWSVLDRLLSSPEKLANIATKTMGFITAQQGALARTNQQLLDLGVLSDPS